MSESLILVNPRKRRKTRKDKGKRRVKRRAIRRNPHRTVGRKSPTVKRRARRTAVVPVRSRRIRRNPARRGIRRMTMRGLVDQQLIPAAIGASGALGLDVAMGYIARFAPNMITVGPTRHLIKGAAAIGIGMVAGMVVRPKTASEMSKGALTVIFHDLMKETTQQFAPNIPLGEYVSAYNGNGDAYNNYLGYTAPSMPVGTGDYAEAYYDETNDLGEYI